VREGYTLWGVIFKTTRLCFDADAKRRAGEGAWVGRAGDDARHSQGLTKVPRHIPRLAFRASFSATT
jgi:hypothetical protein